MITLGVLWLAPSGDYLLLPDEAHPVAPLVTVEKPKRGGGKDGIYFVDLLQRRATLLESIFPGIRDGATLVPEDSVSRTGSRSPFGGRGHRSDGALAGDRGGRRTRRARL